MTTPERDASELHIFSLPAYSSLRMPSAPLRFCSTTNCAERVVSGKCARHRQDQRLEHRRYQTTPGLNYGRRWQRLAKSYLAHHPLCVDCGRMATEVDHIIPHRGDSTLFFSESNWAPRCKPCHSRKTAREVGFRG